MKNGEARIGRGVYYVWKMLGVCRAGSGRVGATLTDEQQAQRKERHSKHKQWYSGFSRLLRKMTSLGKRRALFVGTAADDHDGTTAKDQHHRGRWR